MLDIIQDYLNYKNYKNVRLDGSVRDSDRYQEITQFGENSDIQVFDWDED